MNSLLQIVQQPYRDYVLSVLLISALLLHHFFAVSVILVVIVAALGSIIPLWEALDAVRKRTVTIEAFNFFALAVSFGTQEYVSAAFIALMLTFAEYLDWRTETRASNAVEELLKLKPSHAFREQGERVEEVAIDAVAVNDIIIVKNGERVPVDGTIIFGTAFINESALTGESKPVEKHVGDEVYSSSLSESGVIKLRATKVGADSTIERMAKLIAEAGKNKSRAERLADKFAGYFLPIVIVAGVATYLITKDASMTAALFLVVCADDVAVSIPLAITASLGYAAKRGVIIKGGEYLNALAGVRTLAFDKTGTLTYGHFALSGVEMESGVSPQIFWRALAIAEKFSEHPVGKAIYREAVRSEGEAPDPDEVKVHRGAGIWAKGGGMTVAIGNERIAGLCGYVLSDEVLTRFHGIESTAEKTTMMVFLEGVFSGFISIADVPRVEARESLRALSAEGIRLVMLTGDNEDVARAVSAKLGITEFRAEMTPESKMREIELLAEGGGLAMVGDGVNDAPALARADVGIAMGEGGTAVAVETANVVILTDQLDRIPEMIALARRTVLVVNGDMIIWGVTNVIGLGLVFTGIATPPIAALYNLATDFLPLLNSARLFRHAKR